MTAPNPIQRLAQASGQAPQSTTTQSVPVTVILAKYRDICQRVIQLQGAAAQNPSLSGQSATALGQQLTRAHQDRTTVAKLLKEHGYGNQVAAIDVEVQLRAPVVIQGIAPLQAAPTAAPTPAQGAPGARRSAVSEILNRYSTKEERNPQQSVRTITPPTAADQPRPGGLAAPSGASLTTAPVVSAAATLMHGVVGNGPSHPNLMPPGLGRSAIDLAWVGVVGAAQMMTSWMFANLSHGSNPLSPTTPAHHYAHEQYWANRG